MESEKRKHSRVPIRLKLAGWPVPALKGYSLCSYDISKGGIKVEISPPLSEDVELKENDMITVSFELSPDEGYLTASSRVVWRKDGEEISYIGAEFLTIPESIYEKIDNFLERHSGSKKEE